MPTVSNDLDTCLRLLRDSGTVLWTRAELLQHYNDAYRQLLAQSHGVRQFTVLPMPPRHAYTLCYPWERRYLQGGTGRQWLFTPQNGGKQCTYLWEIEQAAGFESTNQYTAVTHGWELAYASGAVDQDYRFALPKNHERIKGIWFDHKYLTPLNTREMDTLETAWNRSQGEPWFTIPGMGDTRSVEVYQIRAEYTADYALLNAAFYGLPRTLSGARDWNATTSQQENGFAYTTQGESLHIQWRSHRVLSGFGLRITSDPTPNPGGQYQSIHVWERERHEGATSLSDSTTIGTYWWEADYGATNTREYSTGILREITSPDRQYLPVNTWEAPFGLIRDFRSSVQNLLLHEAIVPDVPTLAEEDTPAMIPAPLQKYLRYYVLYCAFNRQGEGYRPDLAGHWLKRWERGPQLLRKLGDCTWADTTHQRQPAGKSRHMVWDAPLPAEYGRVRV